MRRVLGLSLVLLAALVALGGCARSRPEASSRECPCEEGVTKPVDQSLLAWLSKARTLHHLADLAEDEGSIDKAVAELEQLVNGTLPRGEPPEAAEVMADTYARLAELRTRQGDFVRADQDIASGLKYAAAPTYFRGHLLEVRGLAYQKQGDDLAKAGKASEAKAAREKALAASVEALRIQDDVIKSALGDAGPNKTRD